MLEWMENTGLSRFINESGSLFAFPGFLLVHVVGLSILAGCITIVSIRMLGVASTIPLQPLKRLFPFMWAGFLITLVSGIPLTMARASFVLSNPVLLTKIVLIAIAITIMRVIQKSVFSSPAGLPESNPGNAKLLASAELVLWLLVMVLGRLIAYKMAIFD